MQIKICVFAAMKEYFEKEFVMEVRQQMTIVQLKQQLISINPMAEQIMKRCRFAINDSFVSPEYIIDHEQIICVIPPSSGG